MTTTAVSLPNSHGQVTSSEPRLPTRPQATHLRVMMFEPLPERRDASAEHLRNEGYEVLFAEDADDFMEEIQAHSPDAVIVDLGPKAGGIELLRRMRSLEINVPVIAFADRENNAEAGRLGVVASISNPSDHQDLSIQLRRAIGEGRLPREMHLGDEGCPFELPINGVDLESVERGLLAQALTRTNGNQSRAARLLGISRYALRYRMQKFKLT